MNAILLIDFGSTNTKVTAVDLEAGALLGTAVAFTTVETDVGEGLAEAMKQLRQQIGDVSFCRRLACSSAAGGLRMAASGLVPGLTAEAARLASLGAGAKVIRTYSYQLTDEDAEEIAAMAPDIFLLTGGTDGGNTDCIIHNAKVLAECPGDFPIILAGNRNAAGQCEKILQERQVIRCPNVMPKFNKPQVEPVQKEIRRLFLERIINARGLTRESQLLSGILMPTPAAVKEAMELLSRGTKGQEGMGDLVAVDLGGATTDVYSVADGLPSSPNTMIKGMLEPHSKRTVEGDLGMRYSAAGVLEAAGASVLSQLSGIGEEDVEAMVTRLVHHPDALPQNQRDADLDFALAAAAVETAVARHSGSLEQIYTIAGPAWVQEGKDLRQVKALILTGGAIVRNSRAGEVAAYARFNPKQPLSLRPENADIYVDQAYILAAMGLLSEDNPEIALSIMKKELIKHGAAK